MPRSVYYYHLHSKDEEYYVDEKKQIQKLFHAHKGRYGYRRIMLALRRLGYHLNHKTVAKLMNSLGLKSMVRPKRYASYRGDVGKIAGNNLERNFNASRPNQKWVTDVTEFNIKGERIYLSPILDLYNQEIVSYTVRSNAQFPLVMEMLKKGIKRLKPHEQPILHSDQGWQYQMAQYQRTLEKSGLVQSMSRKGNCLDNAVMEGFFAILKTELYHGHEFDDANDFVQELDKYIKYYNNVRIKEKLDGLSPVEYRRQAEVLN